jgi:hypothetical protein
MAVAHDLAMALLVQAMAMLLDPVGDFRFSNRSPCWQEFRRGEPGAMSGDGCRQVVENWPLLQA